MRIARIARRSHTEGFPKYGRNYSNNCCLDCTVHTEDFTILLRYKFYQVPSYMPSSPLGVYKPLISAAQTISISYAQLINWGRGQLDAASIAEVLSQLMTVSELLL